MIGDEFRAKMNLDNLAINGATVSKEESMETTGTFNTFKQRGRMYNHHSDLPSENREGQQVAVVDKDKSLNNDDDLIKDVDKPQANKVLVSHKSHFKPGLGVISKTSKPPKVGQAKSDNV